MDVIEGEVKVQRMRSKMTMVFDGDPEEAQGPETGGLIPQDLPQMASTVIFQDNVVAEALVTVVVVGVLARDVSVPTEMVKGPE